MEQKTEVGVGGGDPRFGLFLPYTVMLVVYAGFLMFAFSLYPPRQVLDGFIRILLSRSILITDYIEIGGVGATLLNSAAVGCASVLMLMLSKVRPSGAIIMALWMSTGFAFFGKNIFNMIPLTIGVWLYSKYKKESFAHHSLASLLVATLSPAVSEISFLGVFGRPAEIAMGIVLGFFIGFVFPAVSKSTLRVYQGFNLYNMGFAGGLISTMLVSILRSMGIEIPTVKLISTGNNLVLSAFLYTVALGMLLFGIFSGDLKLNLKGFLAIFKRSGELPTDYYFMFGNSVYINMAALCAFSTTLVLVLGAQLNGPAIAGIFTIMGFGSLGKHLRNVIPIFIGAIISAYINQWDFRYPTNIIAILFSTGLAPIAGKFGWLWGIAAGFLHVNIAMHIGYLNSGLNLYNNGFAAGFVAMILLPLISVFSRQGARKI